MDKGASDIGLVQHYAFAHEACLVASPAEGHCIVDCEVALKARAFPLGLLLGLVRLLHGLCRLFLLLTFPLHLVLAIVRDELDHWEVVSTVCEYNVDGVKQLCLDSHLVLSAANFSEFLQGIDQLLFEAEIEEISNELIHMPMSTAW